ncbi:MAG: DUF58 domain-containing protein [Campylobacterales bacterium]|nr:DUF58 domain-containing protein [Campylobacterales bacterium]
MKSFKTYISILKGVKNRPTKYFVFLVIAIVSLFLQAYMHNYNIVFLVMFFLVAIAGSSSIFGMLNLYYIHVKLLSYERLFADTSSTYKLLVINESDNPAYDISVTWYEQTQPITSIEPHNTQTIAVEVKFGKRGETKLSEIKISSLFPLPHELKYKVIEMDKKVVVYAKPSGVSLLKFIHKNNAINGEIDEFEGIKKFNQGDNLSYIHWASLAKHDALMSKNFIYEDESKKLHFDFKTINGTDEEKLSQLTLWVIECEKQSFDFTIDLNGEILDSKKMSSNEILEAIATY